MMLLLLMMMIMVILKFKLSCFLSSYELSLPRL